MSVKNAASLVTAAALAASAVVVMAPTAAASGSTANATNAGETFGGAQAWTQVTKKHPNRGAWKSSESLRTGNEGGSEGLSRSFVRLDTSAVKGAPVAQATLRIRNTGAGSCTATPVELWSVGAISANTTWNNQPAKGSKLATVKAAKGRPGCAAGDIEFDATALVKEAAAKSQADVTVGLYASDETDTTAWKRFDARSAVLETKTAAAPTVSDPGTSPATACTGGLVGNTRVSLFATVDGPEEGGLTAQFQVFRAGQSAPALTQSVPAVKSQATTWSVPDADLPTGDYTWNVRGANAAGQTSAWSATCAFSVDRTRPNVPPVIGSVQFPDASNGVPSQTGTARTPGTFTFAAGGVEDVAEIVYWTDWDSRQASVAPGAAVTLVPPTAGPHSVHAQSVDKAGNVSDTATYSLFAKGSTAPDAPGDLNGDGHRDLWTVDPAGRLQFRAGKGDGTFAAPADGGLTVAPGAQVLASGDWSGDGYNDLVVLEYNDVTRTKLLWMYENGGLGKVTEASRSQLNVSCPVKDPELGCETGDDHWHDAEQIAAAGDVDGDGGPDLLVKQGSEMWLYYGGSPYLDNTAPVLVGGTGWDPVTVVAPGDVNGDGAADLWLREDATGDLFAVSGAKGSDGKFAPASWGSARTKIASGLARADYPVLGSTGDLTGDGLTDLWAVTADGRTVLFRGTADGIDATPVSIG
ncbi:FG-GAP-like repeat-containing protein [Streptomyces sp. NPDC056224]|uniref:FG-GAP-like repeat-containing protein n=1 Tax=Streptomyces sp. NPDC056224 TaxID=3345750 RepID=UPI0035DCB491